MQASKNYARHRQSPDSQSSVIQYITFLLYWSPFDPSSLPVFWVLTEFSHQKEKIIRDRLLENSLHLFIKNVFKATTLCTRGFKPPGVFFSFDLRLLSRQHLSYTPLHHCRAYRASICPHKSMKEYVMTDFVLKFKSKNCHL